MFTSQVELEKYQVDGGRERARRQMEKNENGNRAAHNRYSNPVLDRFVEPLARKIRADIDSPTAGRRRAHVSLLRGLEPEAVAYIAVRWVLCYLLSGKSGDAANGRQVFHGVGKAVQTELVLKQFEEMDPEKYFYLMEELDRKSSANIDHMATTFRHHMRMRDVEPIDWGKGNREQVGTYLCEVLSVLGMIDIGKIFGKGKKSTHFTFTVELSEGLLSLISQVKDLVENTTPYFLPCIERPMDWVSMHDGGYHTPDMRKIASCSAVIGGGERGDCSVVFEALNALQSVRWAINHRVLEVAKDLARMPSLGTLQQQEQMEIVTSEAEGKPERLEFLDSIESKKDMTPEQAEEFRAWKWKVAEWHSRQKMRQTKLGRMFTVFRVADMLKENPEIHFVYQCDFRGRAYPMTSGPNPQGSDLQKGVVHFAEGKPLRTSEAEFWFMCHGASKYGIDKVSLDERVQWVKDQHDNIMATAADPLSNLDWFWNADKPFQFLAWVFEYAEWQQYGSAFMSHLPVSLDGSCNGLQNFSALLRDEVGGEATNLTPGGKPRDIYQTVANRTTQMLESMPEDEKAFRSRWLQHGISRKLCKRSVMTLPYGSTRFSASDFILKDYVRKEFPAEFDKTEYNEASRFLAHVMWKAIGEVVIKAREAMEYLQRSSSKILEQYPNITWTTPNGFRVVQDYRELVSTGQVRVAVYGGAVFKYATRSRKADHRQHKNGVAPNFIHSMDASHMQRVVVKAWSEGMRSIAAIHDDFGVHAADTARFGEIIREEFVRMYEQDNWLARYAEGYLETGCDLGLPPEPGKLDLKQVLDSKYFFC